MSLNAARLAGRIDDEGNLCPLFAQDRSRWDEELVGEGMMRLAQSAAGDRLTEYHIEAGIAAQHASAGSAAETNWGEIVRLYDVLMRIRPSPVVALNRAMAIAEAEGAERGLAKIAAIDGVERLAGYPFYPAAVAELELRLGRPVVARKHFELARALARNDVERRFLEGRLGECTRMLSS